MQKLTIKRDKWLRGEGSGNSYLLRPEDNKMCCLGFYALECGYIPVEINHIADPESLVNQNAEDWEDPHLEPGFDQLLQGHGPFECTTVARDLMLVNDTIIHKDGKSNTPVAIWDQAKNNHTLVAIDTEAQREELITKLMEEIDVEVEFVNE